MNSYKLPDGTKTDDVEDYVKAWDDLVKPIEDATGYVLFAYDPDVAFKRNDDEYPFPVSLPLDFAIKLSKALRKGMINV